MRILSDITLYRFLALVLIFPLFLQALSFYWIYESDAELKSGVSQLGDYSKVISEIESLNAIMSQTLEFVEELRIEDPESIYELVNNVENDIDESLREIRKNIHLSDASLQLMDELEQLKAKTFSTHRTPNTLLTGFREMKDKGTRLIGIQNKKLRLLLSSFKSSLGREKHISFGLLVLVIIMLICGFVYLYLGPNAQLNLIKENVKRLEEERELLPPIEGRNEVASLSRIFYDVASRLIKNQLENKMFVYSVSHDLRSPVVNISGFTASLVKDLEKLFELTENGEKETMTSDILRLKERIEESIDFISGSTVTVSKIIDSLLELSRVGSRDLKIEKVNLESIAQRSLNQMRETVRSKSGEITISELPEALGDDTLVGRIFTNIFNNALKYTPEERSPVVKVYELHDESTETQAAICIQDNGLGIPEHFEGKIFHAFQQGHPDQSDGQGIGLAMVKKTMERLGGSIQYRRNYGQPGSSFVLIFRRHS